MAWVAGKVVQEVLSLRALDSEGVVVAGSTQVAILKWRNRAQGMKLESMGKSFLPDLLMN